MTLTEEDPRDLNGAEAADRGGIREVKSAARTVQLLELLGHPAASAGPAA